MALGTIPALALPLTGSVHKPCRIKVIHNPFAHEYVTRGQMTDLAGPHRLLVCTDHTHDKEGLGVR